MKRREQIQLNTPSRAIVQYESYVSNRCINPPLDKMHTLVFAFTISKKKMTAEIMQTYRVDQFIFNSSLRRN